MAPYPGRVSSSTGACSTGDHTHGQPRLTTHARRRPSPNRWCITASSSCPVPISSSSAGAGPPPRSMSRRWVPLFRAGSGAGRPAPRHPRRGSCRLADRILEAAMLRPDRGTRSWAMLVRGTRQTPYVNPRPSGEVSPPVEGRVVGLSVGHGEPGERGPESSQPGPIIWHSQREPSRTPAIERVRDEDAPPRPTFGR